MVHRTEFEYEFVVYLFNVATVSTDEPGSNFGFDNLTVTGYRPPTFAPSDYAVLGGYFDEAVLTTIEPFLCIGETLV